MRKAVAIMATAMALSGCMKQPKQLYVDGAWVRLGALPRNPAAAYFVVHGGPKAATLINVSTDVAIKSEMHQSMAQSMQPVTSIDIPADAKVEFRPGGRHVMLYDVNPGIKPGSTMTFTFSFGDGTRILQNAGVVGANDPEPK